MNIEKQVCTANQGKKLHDLGILKFQSEFRHAQYCPDPTGEHEGYSLIVHKDNQGIEMGNAEYISDAFTLSEINVMLWQYAESYVTTRHKWRCGNNTSEFDFEVQCATNQLIALIVDGTLEPEDCNARLTS